MALQVKKYEDIVKTKWVLYSKPRPAASVRMFCFPYMAGGADLYLSWADAFPFLEVIPVQFPGRGARMSEPNITDAKELFHILTDLFFPSDKPFIFMGYSLGGFAAYELAKHVQLKTGQTPLALIICCSTPPYLKRPTLDPYCSEEHLWAYASSFGMPASVTEDLEFKKYVENLVRSDAKLMWKYDSQCDPKLACPLVVFHAENDLQVLSESIEKWKDCTTGKFEFNVLEGVGHFWIKDKRFTSTKFLPMLAEKIGKLIKENLR
eukprot:TRINITY_DN6724_c1_g1_i2.p1 TRINITY_DN6724_c1_g1~~TRINITY_DN6724_c1_g1_i2.p1  ORF type:complete len:264 (+),score=37.22 TRINITY_DN6724_c1_g1_i2:104-895(+)